MFTQYEWIILKSVKLYREYKFNRLMYSLMPSVCSFQLRNWILTELWPFVPEVVAMGVKGQHGAEPWTGIGRHGRCPSFKCRRGCGTRWKLLQNTKIIQKYISPNYNNLFLKTNVLRCNDVHVIHFFFKLNILIDFMQNWHEQL